MTSRALVLFASLFALGCPNPNTYGTPRTVEPGRVSHTVSIEVVGVTGNKGGDATPAAPSYTLRAGLANRLDLGVRAANFSSLMSDLKWNIVRSKRFDLAIDPGAQWMYDRANDVHVVQVHAPIMLGINLRSDLQIVLVPGFTMQLATRETLRPCPPMNGGPVQAPPCGSELTRFLGGTAPMARLGAGLSWRIFRDMAVQPEITVMRQFGGYDDWMVNGGIGVSFLHLPSYEDLDSDDPEN